MTSPAPLLDTFYPIVPDAAWLPRILPLGVKTVQLRIKDRTGVEVARQVRDAISFCNAYGAQLIVNDYWQIAVDQGATFVHLGQEDLAAADLQAIRNAGIKLGISTHDERELEIALAAGPDYVALGPIYETKLKAMTWAPQGLDRLSAWKTKIGALPLVAIGGITPERAPNVMAAGADSLAVITDFITSANPEARIMAWIEWVHGIE